MKAQPRLSHELDKFLSACMHSSVCHWDRLIYFPLMFHTLYTQLCFSYKVLSKDHPYQEYNFCGRRNLNFFSCDLFKLASPASGKNKLRKEKDFMRREVCSFWAVTRGDTEDSSTERAPEHLNKTIHQNSHRTIGNLGDKAEWVSETKQSKTKQIT